MTTPQQVHQDAAKWIKDVKAALGQHETVITDFYKRFITDKNAPTNEDVNKLDAELKRWAKVVSMMHNDLTLMEKAITGYGWRGDDSTLRAENTLLKTLKTKSGH